ncbi:MAG: replicative DNA helicase [Pirellulales bacterium]|nr:replicative DNA helicase [Pirellulales bacterium]
MATHARVDTPNRTVSPDIFTRQVPHDLDAERAVLGSMLLEPSCCDDVVMTLSSHDFYDEAHATLCQHIIELHNEGVRVEATLLIDRLRQQGAYELVGGAAAIAELVGSTPHAAHAVHYAKIVREKAALRELIYASSENLREAYEVRFTPREVLDRADARMSRLLEDRAGGRIDNLKSVLSDALARIDQRMKNAGGISGLETGFVDLDATLGGLQSSELIILAARPSMGKTALAANIAEYASVDLGKVVLFVSLEMSRLELADRLLCSRARVNGHKLRNGTISMDELQGIIRTATQMNTAPLFIDDTPSRTMTEIAATARRLNGDGEKKPKLGLIVIDYLQLIEPDNADENRQEQVAKIARRLKALAREIDVPVLCLAQLNRQAEATKDNRPRLSHLRESGAIEQDADVVMFVHREEYYHTPDEIEEQRLAGKSLVIVAKHRNGPTGEVKLTWLQDYTRFENSAHEYGDGSF